MNQRQGKLNLLKVVALVLITVPLGLPSIVNATTVPAVPAAEYVSTDPYWVAVRSDTRTTGFYLSPQQACASSEYMAIILQATPSVGAISYYGIQNSPHVSNQCLFSGGIFGSNPEVIGYAFQDTRCQP